MKARFATPASLMLAATLLPGGVLAQGADAWPSRPVQVLLGQTPSGPTDIEARLYTQKLGESLGKPFVIDYKPGAAQTLAATLLFKAPADGNTILMVSSGFATTPAFYKNLPYDAVKDFATVSLMTKRPTVLLVNAAFPARNIKEYIAYARAHPGQINWASAGSGSVTHLAGAWLHTGTGTEVTFVHYKGAAQSQIDLMAGRIQITVATFQSGQTLVKSGKVRALAIASGERSSVFPDLPTAAEEVLPGYSYDSWFGVLAPGKTPPAIVNKLSGELSRIAKLPDIVQKFAAEGTVMVGSTPEQFRKHLATEVARWDKLVQDTGIKLDE